MKLKMETSNGKTLIESKLTNDGKVILEPQYLGFIRSHGYALRRIHERHTVASSDGEHAHLVYRIGTYSHPRGSQLLDVSDPEQQVSTWVCSCADFRFTQSADVQEAMVSPDDSGACKHVQEVSKVQKAKADNQQLGLGESNGK